MLPNNNMHDYIDSRKFLIYQKSYLLSEILSQLLLKLLRTNKHVCLHKIIFKLTNNAIVYLKTFYAGFSK